jgi:hypothetical protein
MVVPCLCSFSACIRGEIVRVLYHHQTKIPRRMSEDFCGGELGTDPLRGQQRAACAGEISIQFHTASQLRYSAGS